jgi:hypothetical protein
VDFPVGFRDFSGGGDEFAKLLADDQIHIHGLISFRVTFRNVFNGYKTPTLLQDGLPNSGAIAPPLPLHHHPETLDFGADLSASGVSIPFARTFAHGR